MTHRPCGIAAVAAFAFLVACVAPPSAAAQVCATDTTTADFAAGTLGACYAGESGDGEVLLAPTEGTEFFGGPGLPAGWVFADWTGSGTASVGSGLLTVNSGRVNSDPVAYGPGRALEFVATFGAQTFQHVGLGDGDNSITASGIYGASTRQWTMFSTNNTTTDVFARSSNGTTDTVTSVAVIPVTPVPHLYRIEWDVSEVRYYIDGGLVATHAVAIAGPMRPAISEFQIPAPALIVDWIRMTPFGAGCTFDSAVFDGANGGADWSTLDAGTVLPTGTGITVQTRSGNTPAPDGSWSAFQALSGNTIQSPTRRYLQYRAALSSTDPNATAELEDAEVCYNPCTPSGPEVCDNVDNDCDGQVDEGTGGTPCDTGVPGICADSTSVCTAGVLQCPQTIFPGTETCNNLDDDCDGAVDEGTGGAPCDTGVPGVCAPSTQVCSGGTLQCPQTIFPGTETCNNLDDDCDGAVDEGTGGSPCMTGLLGVCAPGTNQCQSGSLVCVQDNSGGPEVCNGLDDDCDGSTDQGNPGGGGGCVTGTPGICSPGTLQCTGGSLLCQPNATPTTEVCNGLDDNCNGTADEGTGGAACSTGLPGVCDPGTQQCESGTLNCIQNTAASTELCETGQDEDCNGETDEVGCACAMMDTVVSTTQTKINKVKLSSKPGRDKVLAKGTFTLPMAGAIDPVADVVRIRISDNTGLHYEGVIPAGSFVASPSGRRFKYSDKSLANDGIKKAKLAILSDEVTVKYLFKAQGLDQPAFTAGTGTATVIIGTSCFEDSADTCVLSPSGSTAKCR
jgi:Putative metal-binding motif